MVVQYFMNISSDLQDFSSNQYDDKVVLGKFNLKPDNPVMLDFLDDNDVTNLIRLPSVLKKIALALV